MSVDELIELLVEDNSVSDNQLLNSRVFLPIFSGEFELLAISSISNFWNLGCLL